MNVFGTYQTYFQEQTCFFQSVAAYFFNIGRDDLVAKIAETHKSEPFLNKVHGYPFILLPEYISRISQGEFTSKILIGIGGDHYENISSQFSRKKARKILEIIKNTNDNISNLPIQLMKGIPQTSRPTIISVKDHEKSHCIVGLEKGLSIDNGIIRQIDPNYETTGVAYIKKI